MVSSFFTNITEYATLKVVHVQLSGKGCRKVYWDFINVTFYVKYIPVILQITLCSQLEILRVNLRVVQKFKNYQVTLLFIHNLSHLKH